MSAVLAENYQLKWHSHNAHLHSSVAMLYRSDNFTDVTLVTSDGRYLAAHRFVLSSCSSYLNRVLHLGAVNGAHFSSTPLVVVLPPEISYRTMAILLQYMYSGEATVSNDQLNGVLRAGELLRIKGLCHAGNKDKEKRYFSSNVSTHSDTHSRAGSANSGRISNNNYYQSAQSLNKTPESCNPSSSTVVPNAKNPKTQPAGETSNDTQGTSCSKIKEKKQTRENKEKEITKDSLEISSSGEGSEIVVEENMKIELLVKEEPIDWDDDDDMVQDDRGESVASVKAERLSPGSVGETMYAPLTCDMCQQTFTSPALWVRHIETHPVSDLPPKKRKRPQGEDDNEEEEEFQLLRCELCQKMYTSPADWVRHIQSSHTEEQLAVTNSNRRLRKSTLVSCPSCSKTFPSLASMLIHSRTHTGEKPYVCCVCEKGFNVKSNLLRHLRTLHDHLLSPDAQYHTILKDST